MGEDKLVIVKRSGASLVDEKPLFSFDSKCLFCCAGQNVKVFSTVSGECIHELIGHTGQVTGVQIHPKNKLQLLSCSVDQTVIRWDYSDGVLLQRYQLHCPLYGIFCDHLQDSVILIQEPSSKNYHVMRYFMPFTKGKFDSSKSKLVFKTQHHNANRISIGCKGECVVTVQDKKLEIYSLKKKRYQSHMLDSKYNNKFTCVVCHPTEYCIATGTSEGSILFWWNFMSKDKVVKSVSHWHSLSILDLAFTSEGSYLLSGGHECVLVKWQYNSHMKDFLPRLGSPLNYVACSPDNLMFATSHKDNAIRIISNNFKLLQVYQGLTKCHQDGHTEVSIPTGLLCDPRTKCLVMNGQPGHLQFYSVHTDKQLYNLDIVNQNYISPENLNRPKEITKITNAAFNDGGKWLSTVEHWDDGVMSPEIRLKFWIYNDESQTYILNTVVEMPHDKGVRCLKFCPRSVTSVNQTTAVTSSSDGKFKLWRLVNDTDIYRENMKWSCELVGYYHDKPAGVLSFAEDGSLLVVAFGSTLTVWEPEDNVLRDTLISNVDNTPIRNLEFGRKSCCHLLMCSSETTLKCWNLLTCSVQWIVDLQCNILVPDPLSDIMAVVTTDKQLFVFKPSSHEYIYRHTAISKSEILGGVFIPHTGESSNVKDEDLHWQSNSQLYLINRHQELFTVSRQSQTEDGIAQKQKMSLVDNLPQTPFSILMSTKKKKSGISKTESQNQESATNLPTAGYIRQLLDTPPHAAPPVTSLCQKFIESLLITSKSRKQSETTMKGEDEDSDDERSPKHSDSESDMETDNIETRHKFTKIKTVDSGTDIIEQENVSELSDEELVNAAVYRTDYSWYLTMLKEKLGTS